jgi:ABC-type Na+ efflux pump permease subunit
VRDRHSVKNLTITAWIITAIGIVVTAIAGLFGLDALWLLSGVLLVLTGGIKLIMLQLWVRLAKLGTDDHDPINAL